MKKKETEEVIVQFRGKVMDLLTVHFTYKIESRKITGILIRCAPDCLSCEGFDKFGQLKY